MIIKLLRHGESQGNVDRIDYSVTGDYSISLTPDGLEQARAAGASLGADWLRDALVYSSPYHRARQTLQAVYAGAGLANGRHYEDPRLREQERGYTKESQADPRRATFGWFYFRHDQGESPADVFDRTSGFLESLMRQLQRRPAGKVLIVTHGMVIRCFVMRFFHLSVEEFESLRNPRNCDVITLGPVGEIDAPQFQNGRWAVSGLRLRDATSPEPDLLP